MSRSRGRRVRSVRKVPVASKGLAANRDRSVPAESRAIPDAPVRSVLAVLPVRWVREVRRACAAILVPKVIPVKSVRKGFREIRDRLVQKAISVRSGRRVIPDLSDLPVQKETAARKVNAVPPENKVQSVCRGLKAS